MPRDNHQSEKETEMRLQSVDRSKITSLRFLLTTILTLKSKPSLRPNEPLLHHTTLTIRTSLPPLHRSVPLKLPLKARPRAMASLLSGGAYPSGSA
ncbi:hypothetical protein BST61_g6833 [Cercospora zeina]